MSVPAFTRSALLSLLLLVAGCQSTVTGPLDSQFSSIVDKNQIETSEAELPVLQHMLANDKLSERKIREITELALSLQSDPNQPWSGAWGNWIESARAHGDVSDTEFRTYAGNSESRWEFSASRAIDDDTGRFGLQFNINHLGGRVASVYSPYGLEVSFEILELTVEGIPIVRFQSGDGGKWSFTSHTGHGRSWFRTPDEIPGMESLKSGKHQATIILEETIYESKRPDNIHKLNRIELKDDFEYYRNLYFPKNMKQMEAQQVNPPDAKHQRFAAIRERM